MSRYTILITLVIFGALDSFPSEDKISASPNLITNYYQAAEIKTDEIITQINPENSSDPCLQEKRVGPCKAAIPRVFFNKVEGKCQTFIWGGCGKDKNNFDTLAECEKACHVPPVQVPVENEICKLPPIIPTECSAFVPRWTYNSTEDKCVKYIYGGCRATQNNFRSKQQCEATCAKKEQSKDVVCNLPKEVGKCYAHLERYYFNKRNNRCQRFTWGGCGKNENNFITAEDCARTCGGDAPSEDTTCDDVECPWELYTHYTSLRCKPIYDDGSCCPTRFDCPDTFFNNNSSFLGDAPRCAYRGKLFEIGEDVKEASDTGSCRAACICTENHGKGQILCAPIECPEHFSSWIPPNCFPLYKLKSCCAYDFYCPNDTLTIIEPNQGAPPSSPPTPIKCSVDGKSYYEGQRFYPKKASCLRCICKRGFKGDLSEDFCEQIDCGIEIYYSDYLNRGCAPVYYQSDNATTSCCPHSWECPEDNTIPREQQTQPKNNATTTPPIIKNKIISAEACNLTKVVGPCKGSRPRYFYNKDSNSCEPFLYSGCSGNDNNFVSIRDCARLCVLSSVWPVLGRSSKAIYVSEVDPCTLPKKAGVCKGYFVRYFYSPQQNSCAPFIYGGCGGNENNFYSKESCEAACKTRGVEDASTVRFTFGEESNTRSQNLMPNYGDSIMSSRKLVERCQLPRKSGSCLGLIPSYYYNVETKKCDFFFYSGCFGNGNRFSTLDECENQCGYDTIGGRMSSSRGLPWRQIDGGELGSKTAKPTKEELCKLPTTSCSTNNSIQYAFNSTSKQCQPVCSSGNSFLSESDCLSVCGEKPMITIEQLHRDGLLSCSFGNETLSVGATVRKLSRLNNDDEVACGVTLCRCITPPSVTCFEKICPTRLVKVCPTPSCASNCEESVGPDGCPSCDCDEQQVEEIFIEERELQ